MYPPSILVCMYVCMCVGYIVFLGGQHMNMILFISVMYRTYEEDETTQAK